MVSNIHIMGIVNLTPDSFYAGSRTALHEVAAKVQSMWESGADVVDLGACSTRPGSPQPSLEEEWARMEPALKALASWELPEVSLRDHRGPRESVIPGVVSVRANTSSNPQEASACKFSIDTYRPEIVRRAYEIIGPFIVNDISGGTDPDMLPITGRLGLPYVATHSRPFKGDVTEDALDFFREFDKRAADAGITDWLVDPGFGFAKELHQNYELLENLERLQEIGRPILVGVSRKSMIYKTLGITPEEAMPATEVVQFAALLAGATWLRVHDVIPAVQTAKLYSTMYTSSPGAAK